MPARVFILAAVTAMGLINGCSQSSAPSPVAGPSHTTATIVVPEKAVPAASLPPLDPVSEDKARDFGQRMIDAIVRGDAQANGLEDFVDWNAMLDRSYQGLNVTAVSQSDFLRGFMKSVNGNDGLPVRIRACIQNGGSYLVTRVLNCPEGTRLRLRLLPPEGGVNFHEFLLRDGAEGLRAVDLRIAISGEDLSSTFRRLMVLHQAQENRSFLDRLSGREVAFAKHWPEFGRMSQCNQQSKFEETLKIAATLPVEVRNEKFCMLTELTAALKGGVSEALVEVMDRYHSVHPDDPALEILSIDYYAAKGDLIHATDSARRLNKSLGGDGYVLSLIADLQWQTGLLKEARQTIEQAIQLEPTLENSYWTKATITAAQQDHAATCDTLKELLSEFQVSLDLSAFESGEVFEGFQTSPEFKELKALIESQSKAP